jgi:hypothetical protein
MCKELAAAKKKKKILQLKFLINHIEEIPDNKYYMVRVV